MRERDPSWKSEKLPIEKLFGDLITDKKNITNLLNDRFSSMGD